MLTYPAGGKATAVLAIVSQKFGCPSPPRSSHSSIGGKLEREETPAKGLVTFYALHVSVPFTPLLF